MIAFDRWAAAGRFDTAFYVVQAAEPVAGTVNFVLMGLNVRDGLRIAGRLRVASSAPVARAPDATSTLQPPALVATHRLTRRQLGFEGGRRPARCPQR